MPIETIPGTNERYFLLAFDKSGVERKDDRDGTNGLMSASLLTSLPREHPTDIFFFSHGWKGDIGAARDQYNRWIKAMLDLGADRQAMGPAFKPAWIGLHWPSLPFGDEELGGASFDAGGEDAAALSPEGLVDLYVDRLALGEESRPLIRNIVDAHRRDAAAAELPPDAEASYRSLAEMAGRNQSEGPSGPPEADGEPFDPNQAFQAGNAAAEGADFGEGGFLGGILGPLRQLSYWTMKKRARSIGESGMHAFLTALMNALPKARIHLMGHSFGCIVASSMLGGPSARHPLPRAVDSLALVQGAVSLWAFADSIPNFTGTGYFNPWVTRKAVRGPVIVTRSKFDKAVGIFYPLASAAVLAAPDFDPDDDHPPRFGAIGAFGMRGLSTATRLDMLPETQSYGFEQGKVYNLEASKFIRKGDGASGAHSDIDGPQVAHAIWQAASV